MAPYQILGLGPLSSPARAGQPNVVAVQVRSDGPHTSDSQRGIHLGKV